ncbi:MAG: FAD-dependent oxidoreductase, partial [Oscillospiraceae bacterium]|nr:FAD-dependent oxidoreductase [Oscillospiraceae bacterium]
MLKKAHYFVVLIIGAGPAGIFTALELIRVGKKRKIVLIEKGRRIEQRHC